MPELRQFDRTNFTIGQSDGLSQSKRRAYTTGTWILDVAFSPPPIFGEHYVRFRCHIYTRTHVLYHIVSHEGKTKQKKKRENMNERIVIWKIVKRALHVNEHKLTLNEFRRCCEYCVWSALRRRWSRKKRLVLHSLHSASACIPPILPVSHLFYVLIC